MFALLLLLIFISLLIYSYYRTNLIYKYWEKKGVYYVKPIYLFGNIADNIFQKKSISDMVSDLYNSNKNARYVGLYQCFTPTLLIRDPELIKQITIKHFDSFPDHHIDASKEADPMWANSILLKTHNTGWQETRSKMSPIFTGRKLRHMIPLIQDCSQKLIQYLKLQKKDVGIDVSKLFRKIQNDIIATVAFGVQINSLTDENNEFLSLATKASDFSGYRGLLFAGYSLFPTFMKFFRFKMFNKTICTFFRGLIEESIKVRIQEKVYRPDFIHLLATTENILNENNVNEIHLPTIIDYITAQSMFFFFAGFETTSSIMTFFAYELAINPDVQEKVYREVMETIANNDSLTYETIVGMKYLDNVVLEMLRLYLPTAIIDRKCRKSFTIEPQTPDERPLNIDKNTCIWIPMRSIHRDPKYFTNPEKFDPERFNRDNIQQCTFIPFGSGPRKCIGERFAILEMKLVFVEIIRHYKFVPTEKTEDPLTFKIDSFFLRAKNKIWLKLKPRTQ